MSVSRFLSIVVFVAAFAACSMSVSAQQFGPSELIQAAKLLEESPFDKNAEAIRAVAIRYVIETSDVSVTVCGGDITKPFLDKKNKNSTELVGQYTIAMAAFKLKNPTQKDDENAAQLAGLESVLRTYEAMITVRPKTKHAMMDEYLLKRDRGELKTLVEGAACGKK